MIGSNVETVNPYAKKYLPEKLGLISRAKRANNTRRTASKASPAGAEHTYRRLTLRTACTVWRAGAHFSTSGRFCVCRDGRFLLALFTLISTDKQRLAVDPTVRAVGSFCLWRDYPGVGGYRLSP
jgi:hypothetical protein